MGLNMDSVLEKSNKSKLIYCKFVMSFVPICDTNLCDIHDKVLLC